MDLTNADIRDAGERCRSPAARSAWPGGSRSTAGSSARARDRELRDRRPCPGAHLALRRRLRRRVRGARARGASGRGQMRAARAAGTAVGSATRARRRGAPDACWPSTRCPQRAESRTARLPPADPAGRPVEVTVTVTAGSRARRPRPARGRAAASSRRRARRERAAGRRQPPRIRTANDAARPLAASAPAPTSRCCSPTRARGAIAYAGIPWYVAPFGRDSLITALQLLAFAPELARGTLRFLARHQGHGRRLLHRPGAGQDPPRVPPRARWRAAGRSCSSRTTAAWTPRRCS